MSITGQTSDSAGGAHSATLITPTWYFSSSFASTSAFHAFDTLLQPIRSQSTSSTRPDEVRTWHAEHFDETEEDFVGDFNLAQPSSMAWTIQDLDSVHAAIVALSADSQSSVDGLDPQVTAAAVGHVHRSVCADAHVERLAYRSHPASDVGLHVPRLCTYRILPKHLATRDGTSDGSRCLPYMS